MIERLRHLEAVRANARFTQRYGPFGDGNRFLEFCTLGEHVAQVEQRHSKCRICIAERDFLYAKRVPDNGERFVRGRAPVQDQNLRQEFGGIRCLQRIGSVPTAYAVETGPRGGFGPVVQTFGEQNLGVGKWCVPPIELPYQAERDGPDESQRASDHRSSRANHMFNPFTAR